MGKQGAISNFEGKEDKSKVMADQPSTSVRQSLVTPEHVAHLEKLIAAAENIYAEIMGQSAHDRLDKARTALHQALVDGAPAVQALKDELAAIKAAAMGEPTDSKPN